MNKSFITVLFLFIVGVSFAQLNKDTAEKTLNVNGNIGVTNNGISIIPTFSLGQPAFNVSFSISKGGRFSIDPDLRLTFDGRKGGGMIWFRYKLVNDKKFHFTVGAHPAFNLALKDITENGDTWSITQARRFLATELAPSFTVSKNFGLGLYYLHGNGLQTDGPTSTHFVNFSAPISDLSLGANYTFAFNPQVYYLQVDNEDGFYLTGNVMVSNAKSPFALMAMYNKEIRSNITGSKNFDWNMTLMYKFDRKYKRVK